MLKKVSSTNETKLKWLTVIFHHRTFYTL